MSLLQVKVSENLLDKLKRISESLNLNMSAYIKMVLTKELHKHELKELTENWFLVEEEEKIIKSIKQTDEDIKKWKIKAKKVNDFLNSF